MAKKKRLKKNARKKLIRKKIQLLKDYEVIRDDLPLPIDLLSMF